jgi:Helix-turn-helix domain
MSSLAFFYLVVSCSMTVGEAARRYGKSVRTIRRWCEEASISHRVGGGPHRISAPLADLYAFGRRAEIAAFVDGKPPAEVVCEAFELHGVLDRLVDFHERRLRAEAKRAPPRLLRPLRQA